MIPALLSFSELHNNLGGHRDYQDWSSTVCWVDNFSSSTWVEEVGGIVIIFMKKKLCRTVA